MVPVPSGERESTVCACVRACACVCMCVSWHALMYMLPVHGCVCAYCKYLDGGKQCIYRTLAQVHCTRPVMYTTLH